MRWASFSSASPTLRLLRESIAHHDPVDRLTIALGPLHLLLPDDLAVGAGAEHARRIAADLGQQIHVDEAVVDRRDQRVGDAEGVAREEGIAAGAVDDD